MYLLVPDNVLSERLVIKKRSLGNRLGISDSEHNITLSHISARNLQLTIIM